jgi:hypothetical protein
MILHPAQLEADSDTCNLMFYNLSLKCLLNINIVRAIPSFFKQKHHTVSFYFSDAIIQNMMRDLHKGIKHSDWLRENTAEKWVSENPDLAKEYMDAAAKGLNS